MAAIFEASGTIDFFNAIYGRIDTEIKLAVDCMPGMASAEAPFLARAGAFKQAVGLPVFHATRITSLETARRAIRDGLLDMVAMTRAHIADPELVAKLARGEGDRVRPCVGTTHCMGPLRPTCIHNPSTGHEATLPHTIERADESAECWLRAAARPGSKPRGSAPSAAMGCGSARRRRGSAGRCCWPRRRAGGAISSASSSGDGRNWSGSGSIFASTARSNLGRLTVRPMSSSSPQAASPTSNGSTAPSTAPASGTCSRAR